MESGNLNLSAEVRCLMNICVIEVVETIVQVMRLRCPNPGSKTIRTRV